MAVELRAAPFDPWSELQAHQARHDGETGKIGAATVFVGTMRDMNLGDNVEGMTLEHYPGMTEKHLEAIEAEARRHWSLDDSLIMHRIGAIAPGESIVLVAVWAGHRNPVFQACRYIIEELKHRAPFWKQEHLAHGTRWVAENSPADH